MICGWNLSGSAYQAKYRYWNKNVHIKPLTSVPLAIEKISYADMNEVNDNIMNWYVFPLSLTSDKYFPSNFRCQLKTVRSLVPREMSIKCLHSHATMFNPLTMGFSSTLLSYVPAMCAVSHLMEKSDVWVHIFTSCSLCSWLQLQWLGNKAKKQL